MRHILKKVVSYILILAMMLGCLSGCGSVSDTAKKAGQKVSDLGHEVAERASDSAYKAKKAVSELSMPDFKKGFDTAAGFFGATVASLGGQIYVENVGLAISKLETDIANRVSISGSIASNAGNLAEEWHAGTYNIDAVAKGFKAKASTPKSNALGSADVAVGDDVKASLKYLKDANQSASEQAKNYIERYHEYDGPMTMDEWLASNDINIAVDDPDLYWSIYKDQIRIIPSDQLDDAVKCLEKSIAKESAKSGANRQYVAQADIETLQNLTDRIKTSDGVESIPLSKEEAEAIAKAAKEGDFTASEFGITKASSIKSSYVARQAVKAGATSAIIEAALVLGPEIYEIIKYGIENGQLDEEELKTAGIDGLSAAGDGFLKGSISNALVVMCKAGKLGAEYANPSPELIGAMTVLVIDGIKYGIMLGNGKISTTEYIDTMAQEVLVSAGTLGTAALVGMLFPGATLAIMLGSFVGGLVISAGYTTGKTYALAWIENTGVDLLLPVDSASESLKGVKETIKMKASDAIKSLKSISSKTTKGITIKVYDLTLSIQL